MLTAGQGYLTFMGNEFGHPEWVDFPREGNGWSYKYARRQWSLADNRDLKYHYLNDWERELLHLFSEKRVLESSIWAEMPFANVADQVLAVSRSGLVFLFSFNPSASFSDYPVDLPPGRYNLLFSSDDAGFGGHGRIAAGQEFHTAAVDGRSCIRVYLPARTCMVLEKL